MELWKLLGFNDADLKDDNNIGSNWCAGGQGKNSNGFGFRDYYHRFYRWKGCISDGVSKTIKLPDAVELQNMTRKIWLSICKRQWIRILAREK